MVVKNYCTQLFSRSWGKLSGLRVKMSYEQIIIIQCGLFNLLYLPQFQFYNMVDNGTHKRTMYHLKKNMNREVPVSQSVFNAVS